MSQSSLPLILKNNQQQILNWIDRNPIFDPSDNVEREVVKNRENNPVCSGGVPMDACRGYSEIKRDVWQKGDILILSGPILCRQDAITYLTCLYFLKQQQRLGNSYMSLRISFSDIRESLGLMPTRANWEALHRSIRRLALSSVNYREASRREYCGTLSVLCYVPTSSVDGFYSIDFDEYITPCFNAIQRGVNTMFFQKKQSTGEGL